MVDSKRTALVILVALALGYGVVFELKLHLTPNAAKAEKEPQLLQAGGHSPPRELRIDVQTDRQVNPEAKKPRDGDRVDGFLTTDPRRR
jgi:hypothetical protein